MLKTTGCLATAVLLLSACGVGSVPAGETRHETKSIELDKSETTRVEIHMGAGELHVKASTPKLLEADFTYNVPDWKPVVEYKPGPSGGELTISQPKDASTHFSNTVYTWDLKLTDQKPLDLTANLGAGEATLELGQMNLRNVSVSLGAGELKMDLRGEPKHDFNVRIQGGVGEATVQLPKDVAISATATGGIGEINTTGLEKRDGVWVNPERLNAPVTVHLDVKGGIGEIHLVR
jgi:N-terminal domain of toast_rack, DUF2154